MFIGHFGLALALKRAAPRTSLGTLTLATEFADVLWPVLLAAGVEHVRIAPGITKVTPLDFYDYPVSHSLLMDLAWGAVFAAIYYAVHRYARGAWVLAIAVVSHWFLDYVVHRPDLPLYPGGKGILDCLCGIRLERRSLSSCPFSPLVSGCTRVPPAARTLRGPTDFGRRLLC